LELFKFNIPFSSGCKQDNVEVFDGVDNTARLLGTFCGTPSQRTVTSSKNNLFVSFTSDGRGPEGSFKLKYTAVDR